MKRLENLILDTLDEESLYLLGLNYPSLKIDEEWKRRLMSCDARIYIPVLNFFLEKNINKTLPIRQGLYALRNCFPWRIGVVYDFKTGVVKSIEIKIGINLPKYKHEGNVILFSWLDANESKKLLREVISVNSLDSLFSTKSDRDEEIRDMILNNKKLHIEVITLRATHQAFRSFPQNNPLGEDYLVYPYKIYDDNTSITLSSNRDAFQTILYTNIPINFSAEVIKYLKVLRF